MSILNKIKALAPNRVDPANIAIFCLLLMIAGFLYSRALLTVGMALMGAHALITQRKVQPKEWTYIYWGLAWLLLYGLSGLWSEDLSRWWSHFFDKWPLVLLPLAFFLGPRWKPKALRFLVWGTGLLLLSGVAFSLLLFMEAPEAILESYGYAKVMPTPAEGDHIRFSLSLAIYIFLALGTWPHFAHRAEAWTMGLLLAILIIYIHWLAARTGLAVLYFGLFLLGFRLFLRQSRIKGLGFLVIMVLGFYLAREGLPTLQSKWGYALYTLEQWNSGNRSLDYSDIGRWTSWELAREEIEKSPWIGVGAGDQYAVMHSAYQRSFPSLDSDRVLLPHNQWLAFALAMGIPATVLFLIWFFYPLRFGLQGREGFYLLLIWACLFLPLMVEPMLEIQYGVFVYAVFGGIALKIHSSQKEQVSEEKSAKR